MTSTADFAKMVPGFDFLQGLVKNAGSALPNIGQWVAPTINPEELEKKIEELRTVQFWLEQNARMLGATIQAMEVQRMTLSTLKTMNVSMGELRDSMTLKMPEAQAEPEPKANPFAAPPAQPKPAAKKAEPKAAAAAAAPGVVDPMQWWGALTKQFTELAAGAMKDTASDAAKNLATTMMKQSFDAAGETLKKAVAMPAAVAQKAASAAGAAVSAASKSAQSAKVAAKVAAKPVAKTAAKRAPAKAVRRKPY